MVIEPFCQVISISSRGRKVVWEGDHRARAEAAYAKQRLIRKNGDLLLYVDGVQERAQHMGYNRTRW
jgi:hypothetical protein